MPFTVPNNNKSLSVRRNPGENKRLLNTNSQSLFTFGDFKIERSKTFDYITGNTTNLSFDGFSTLDSLNVSNLQVQDSIFSVGESELNHNPEDPKSHVYFSSFYTDVAKSINNIIDNYPYSILSTANGSQNIFNYAEDFNSITGNTSTFELKQENLINQGGIILNSGNTVNKVSLIDTFSRYAIKIKGELLEHKILSYTYISSLNILKFKIEGELLGDDSYTDLDIYIKPIVEDIISFKQKLSSLENQLLGSGKLMIPSMSDDSSFLETFKWPKTIDGIAPDSFGSNFDSYKNDILTAAEKIDEEKTNIFLKTIIPENYLEFDSNGHIYRTLVQTYAYEFDSLKKYVDGMAYAHSIDYSKNENVPDKFLFKLSNLLGWKLAGSFNEIDLFDYLTTDDTDEVDSIAEFNIEVWKRILTNIVWLYKKKGTRDALSFIFRIMGAPECLINFNEFVYDIEQTAAGSGGGGGVLPINPINPLNPANPSLISSFDVAELRFTPPGLTLPPLVPIIIPFITPLLPPIAPPAIPTGNDKIDSFGFINYSSSNMHFQKGGTGRGNGFEYINQWRPEFDPIIRADNIKVQVGDPDLNIGTKSIINTKEIDLFFDPAKAVECAVFDFYKNLTGFCDTWLWGSPDSEGPLSSTTTYCPNIAAVDLNFGNLDTMTFEEYGNINNATSLNPSAISAMTLSQYIDYIFTTGVNPRNRKTNSQKHNSWHYPELKNLYLAYYTYSNDKLTVGKLEAYLDLLGINFNQYVEQVIPATTIIRGNGSITYRNPIFHRQRFIYKEGIDAGSTFQNNFPENPTPVISEVNISSHINENAIDLNNTVTIISSNANESSVEKDIQALHIKSDFQSNIETTKFGFSINMEIGTSVELDINGWEIIGSLGRSDSQQTSASKLLK